MVKGFSHVCLHPESRHTAQTQPAVPCLADNKSTWDREDFITRPVKNVQSISLKISQKEKRKRERNISGVGL